MIERAKMGRKKMLGQILFEKGYITQFQLNQACQMQIEENKLLGELLVSLGRITEEELKEALELQKKSMVRSNR